jgi:hypothetical protein
MQRSSSFLRLVGLLCYASAQIFLGVSIAIVELNRIARGDSVGPIFLLSLVEYVAVIAILVVLGSTLFLKARHFRDTKKVGHNTAAFILGWTCFASAGLLTGICFVSNVNGFVGSVWDRMGEGFYILLSIVVFTIGVILRIKTTSEEEKPSKKLSPAS